MSDLISRQAAIDAIDRIRVNAMIRKEDVSLAWECADAILQLPSVEQKKREWIDEGQYAEGHSEHAYYCSICEKEYIGYIGEYNFCPNCGADMRGEE